MRKFMLLAAAAALTVPAGAIAQRHDNQSGKSHAQAGQQRNAHTNRQTTRNVQRTVQPGPRTVRSGQRAVDRRVVVDRNRRITSQRTRTTYVAPVRNWNYRPVTVGYRLQPAFYGSRYYISDYGAYHLQAPRYRYLRWIRYGNDLLLVNIRTGRVLQVVHYRYW